jgi:two-component system OmpR family response regulator
VKDPGRTHRVLIVDDHVDTAETFAELLAYWGYETAMAGDGLQALGVAERFKPHVALLDVELPGMTGLELGQRLRDLQGERPTLTLVAVSGFSSMTDKTAATAAGFDHYVVKPVVLKELQELLRSLLDNYTRS